MLQVIYSAGLNGVDGFLVTVECNCSNRMEKFINKPITGVFLKEI